MSRQEYIDKFAPLAIQEMSEFRIPASITMAQACLESSDGNSVLTRKSNNHFGIKCKSSWTGPSVTHDDDEAGECFRKYNSAIESFRDHSKFITGSVRYASLFSLDIRDYQRWAHGLKKAGYATDPAYPSKLIKIIEDFRLYELDQQNGTRNMPGKRNHPFSLFGFLRKSKSSQPQIIQTPLSAPIRVIERRNRKKCFLAVEGDDYAAIAAEFGKKDWQIYQYNDAVSGDVPAANEPVYLQPKRLNAPRGNDFHIVKQGETLRSISQWYGVKLHSLRKKNKLKDTQEPMVGEKVWLR